MTTSREKIVSRSSLNLGIFKDLEADWVFKRTLTYMGEKAAEIGECLSVAKRIDETNWISWVDEWAKMAEQVEKLGYEALQKGHYISARECFLRACNYYRTAEYCDRPSDPRFHRLWMKSRECFHQACNLFNPPIQDFEILFEGKRLPGYFWRPDRSNKKRPTVIVAGGNDSSLEEVVYAFGMAAIRRGYNLFTFDHPGHRGAVHLYPDCIKRHDYEVPYGTALNQIEKLSGVDERIAITGFSFGGFAAIRVAVHEKRIKALIPNPPILDPTEALLFGLGKIGRKIPLFLLDKIVEWKLKKSPLRKSWAEYSAWTGGEHGLKYIDRLKKAAGTLNEGESLWEALQRTNKFVITKQDLKNIICPTLAMVGEDEGDVMIKQAKEFIDSISSEKKDLYIFRLDKDGSIDHCQLDNRSRGSQIMFDWLDEVFVYRYEKVKGIR